MAIFYANGLFRFDFSVTKKTIVSRDKGGLSINSSVLWAKTMQIAFWCWLELFGICHFNVSCCSSQSLLQHILDSFIVPDSHYPQMRSLRQSLISGVKGSRGNAPLLCSIKLETLSTMSMMSSAQSTSCPTSSKSCKSKASRQLRAIDMDIFLNEDDAEKDAVENNATEILDVHGGIV